MINKGMTTNKYFDNFIHIIFSPPFPFHLQKNSNYEIIVNTII